MNTNTPQLAPKCLTKLRDKLCLLLALVCAFTGFIPTRNVIGANAEHNSSQLKLASLSAKPITQESINEGYGKLPLSFEENRGQFDKKVRFFTRGRGYSLFLTAYEMVYVLQSPKSKVQSPKSDDYNIVNRQSAISNQRAVALRMRLVGAETNSPFTATDELPGRINYFKGNNPDRWRTDIRTFERVRYESVWQGVDLQFYSNNQGEFEYDFIVGPQISHNQIALEIEGAEDVRLDQNGDLEIETEVGTITQRKPFTYQESNGLKEEIESRYKVEATDNGGRRAVKFRVSFEVSNYDASKPLVIDPSVNLSNVSFSTFLGGAGDDFGSSLAVDGAGNVYLTGRTLSELFPTISGAFDINPNGGFDAFVTKLNASGTALIYSTFIGGSGNDSGNAIALDAAGNAYITGGTANSAVDFPTTVGAFDTTHNGLNDVFVTKLNAKGTALVYSTFVGGSGNDAGISIAIDSSGNAYTTGQVASANYPTTAGAFDTTHNGGFDVFVTKLNASGSTLDYSTFIGGSDFDTGWGITVNASGDAYVTGETLDSTVDYPTTAGAFNTTHNGSLDVFVTKLNAIGSTLDYSTFVGGIGIDSGQNLAIDAGGNAYIVGFTAGATINYPTTTGAFDTTHNGGNDVFVTKLNPLGAALVYSTFIGGQSNDSCSNIAVDAAGSVYVTGETTDSAVDYPSTTGAFDETHNGGIDVFVSRLNPAGSALLYSTFLGGNGNDVGEGLALDSSGNVYVTGSTPDATVVDLPTTPEAFQPLHNSGNDAFVSKFGDYALAGRTIDSTGAPISGVTVTLSGPQSGVVQSDSQGFFAFTDTLLNANFTVAAARASTTFNPSLFNINSLSGNRYLYFTGTPGAPTGYPGGILRVYPAYSINENENFITIAIERVDVFNQNVVSIDYRTSSGTATANDDFTTSQGTLTFLPLEFVKTVNVPITNDTMAEQAETFTFILSNPTGGAGLSENHVTQITIADDDSAKPGKKKSKVEIMRDPSLICFLPSKPQRESVRRVRSLKRLPRAKFRPYKKVQQTK